MWCVRASGSRVPVGPVGAPWAAVPGPLRDAVEDRQHLDQTGVPVRAGGGAAANGAGSAALA